jgi:tetratricopeptide (TPR) repeat protein
MNYRHLAMWIFVLALALLGGCDGPAEKKGRLLDEGRALFDQGAHDQARAKFAAVVQIDPRSAEAQWMLGRIALHQRRLASAQRHLTRAVELDPSNLGARFELGTTHLGQGEPSRAREQAAAILAADAAHPAGSLLAAAVAVAEGRLAEAVPELDRLMLAGVRLPAAYALRAALYRQAGDDAAAMAALVAGIRRLPEAPGLNLMLARQLAEEERFAAAAVIMGRVAELAPDAPEHRLAQAGLHRLAGQANEADIILDDLLAARAGDPAMVLAIAGQCAAEGLHQRALEVLQVGLEACPGHPELESRQARLRREVDARMPGGEAPGPQVPGLVASNFPDRASALGQVLSAGLAAGPRADPLVAALAGYPAPAAHPPASRTANPPLPPSPSPRAGGLNAGSVPIALWLLGLGLLGLVAVRRKSGRKGR